MKQSLQYIFSITITLFALTDGASQDSTKVANTDSLMVIISTPDSVVTDSLITNSKAIDSLSNKNLPEEKIVAKNTRVKSKKEKLAKSDTSKIKIKGGVQVYIDYGKILTYLSDFEQKFEFGVAYQFGNRFQPNFHFGIGTINADAAIENGDYTSEGSYWRAGINYLVPLDQINRLIIGVRYAQSKFEDSGSYEITSELWPTFSEEFQRSDFEADWFEMIIGSEKMFKNGHLIVGGETGVRIINERDNAEFIDIYTIPGYGLTSDQSTPFLNLYVKYQF